MIQFDINLESIFLDWMFQPSARFISVRFGGSSVQAADMIHILRCSYPSLSSAPRAKLRWKAGSCSCRCPKIFSSPSRPREHHTGKCCLVDGQKLKGSPRFSMLWAQVQSQTRRLSMLRLQCAFPHLLFGPEILEKWRKVMCIAITRWSSVVWAPFWRFLGNMWGPTSRCVKMCCSFPAF